MRYDTEAIYSKIKSLQQREDELCGMMKVCSASSIDVLAKEHKEIIKSLNFYTNLHFLCNEVNTVDDIQTDIECMKSDIEEYNESQREDKRLHDSFMKQSKYQEEIIGNLTERIVRLEQIVSNGKDLKELL